MPPNNEEKEILDLTRKILYAYYVENDLDILFDYMASDIIWVGVAKSAYAEGKETVKKRFLQGYSSMFPCKLFDVFLRAVPIGDNHWLCIFCNDVEPQNTSLYTMRENQHSSVLYRRLPSPQFDEEKHIEKKWEIVHLNNSIAWSKLAEKELFALQAARKNRRLFRGSRKTDSRERLIITLLRQGLSNREIAEHMSVAEITVKKALSKLYRKYGVTNRTGLIIHFTNNNNCNGKCNGNGDGNSNGNK